MKYMICGVMLLSAIVAASAWASDELVLPLNAPDDMARWTVTGDAAIDTSRARGDGGGSLRIGPGARVVLPLRDADGAGQVQLWVFDDLTRPADAKARRMGPRWGLMQSDGRVLVMGALYAPYLGGDTTYAAVDSDGKAWFSGIQYSAIKRTEGWHKWTFDFDAGDGLGIQMDDKHKARFDWNKTQFRGFNAIVLLGDEKTEQGQTIWVDDVRATLSGAMVEVPVPAPPPPPVVPVQDPVLDGPAVQLDAKVMSRHPRLLFGPEDVGPLRAFAASPAGKPIMDEMRAYLPTCAPPAEPKFLTDATDAQRQGLWRLPTAALHYVLTGEMQSLAWAKAYLQMLADLPHWETGNEQDSGMGAANIMIGAALAYDWLYDELDPAFRQAFGQKLLWQARAMYHGGHLKKNPGAHYWQSDPQNNHRWHRDAGMTLAALAAYTGDPGEQWIIARAREDLDFIARWLPDDGTSHESPTYMIFGGTHLTLAMHAADRAMGTSYLQQPFFQNVGRYMTQAITPDVSRLFDYGDSGGGHGGYSVFLIKTTAVHRQPDIFAAVNLAMHKSGQAANMAWLALIWRDPTLSEGDITRLPTRSYFDDVGVALLRDGWTPSSVAAMFKASPFGGHKLNQFRNDNGFPYINVAHDDPDANSFVLWMNGAYLAETDRYAKHKRAINHNTILINGMGQMVPGRGEGMVWSQPAVGDVDMSRMAYVTAFNDSGKAVIVEGEAAGSYLAYHDRATGNNRPALDRFRRTFIWVEGQYVLVLDDIRAPQAVDITWLMQSPRLESIDAQQHRYRLAHERAAAPFTVVANRDLQGRIEPSPAEHRGKPLGWQQLQLTTHAKTLQLASVFDVWNRGNLQIVLESSGVDQAVVRITGPNVAHTWHWHAAVTPTDRSTITGRNSEGATIAALAPR